MHTKIALEEVDAVKNMIRRAKGEGLIKPTHIVLGRMQLQAIRSTNYCSHSPGGYSDPMMFEGLNVYISQRVSQVCILEIKDGMDFDDYLLIDRRVIQSMRNCPF